MKAYPTYTNNSNNKFGMGYLVSGVEGGYVKYSPVPAIYTAGHRPHLNSSSVADISWWSRLFGQEL